MIDKCYFDRLNGGVCGMIGEIVESGVLAFETQFDIADGSVAVFADQYFGDSLLVAIGVVHFVAVDEGDDIRILLDGAGFPQVGKHGFFVDAAFHRPAQLR